MIKAGRSRVREAVAVLALAMMLAACANDRGPHPDLPPLGARMEFLSKNLCSDGIFPEIRLGGVPSNTTRYRVLLTNISILSAPRWETMIKADGPVIPEGAAGDFDLPCPGELQTFQYRLEVMALADDGRPLAYGWSFSVARALSLQIEREQFEAKRRPTDRLDRTLLPAPRRPPFFIQ